MGAASLAFSHLPSTVSSLRVSGWPVCACHTCRCVCLRSALPRLSLLVHVHPESECVFVTAGEFYDVYSLSLPGPGVPVRTPRRPCARLPKTSASPGPPRGRGQPNVTWTLYRVVRGGRGGRRKEERGRRRGMNERETKVRVEISSEST